MLEQSLKRHMILLCQGAHLGDLVTEPEWVTGGLLHCMVKIQTTTGVYAVKLLNPEIMQRSDAWENYLVSEKIARILLRRGLPVVAARMVESHPVQVVNGIHMLVFPWIDGYTLLPTVAPPKQCRQIGSLLAQIHQIDPSTELFLTLNPQKSFSFAHWTSLIDHGSDAKVPWAYEMSFHLDEIRQWMTLCEEVWPTLNSDLVGSHRDLDQKNVLWVDETTPYLIDWEAAGLVHSTKELLGTALVWSGEGTEMIHKQSFDAFIGGYTDVYGAIPGDPIKALYSGYQERLEWLEFNMMRSLKEGTNQKGEQELGIQETIRTIRSLHHFSQNIDVWIQWICR